MYHKSAAFYDAIYSFKDYGAETEKLRSLIERYRQTTGSSLLEVACGTGRHAQLLSDHYKVEGLDLDVRLLDIARQRNPTLTFHQADMVDFDLDREFDVLTCLFGSIGYVQTVERLNQTIRSFARHLHTGGVALVESWMLPDQFNAGHLGAIFIDQPDLKLARINTSSKEGRISTLHFHYLLGTHEGISNFSEDHVLGLFSDAQYRAAFASAGLEAVADSEGLNGRTLYIGVKPR
jgi:ubiquinone/menaquinone biosynthesis C-methylase UbiE